MRTLAQRALTRAEGSGCGTQEQERSTHTSGRQRTPAPAVPPHAGPALRDAVQGPAGGGGGAGPGGTRPGTASASPAARTKVRGRGGGPCSRGSRGQPDA